jgi:PIN domain nuclease of toxin-antitoxin system
VGVDGARPSDAPAGDAARKASAMILLDTSAVLFLLAGHRRARPLRPHAGRLRFTPVALLELHFLQEAGRGVFTTDRPADAVADDHRWTVDDPPLSFVIRHAAEFTWSRDPFDRLIAAHAMYRGWRLATADGTMIENLPSHLMLAL